MRPAHRLSLPARIARAFIYVTVLAFFMFPVFWILMTSLKSSSEFMHIPPVWLPAEPSLASYVRVINKGGLAALRNSLIISSSVTLLSLFIGSLAAYGLARFRVGGNNLPFLFLSQRFMPPVVVIFPFLIIFKALKWVDTYQALIIVHLTFSLPYTIWMMRSFFVDIPREIGESALVDGCSHLGSFFRVAIPLAAPGLIATGVFVFIFSWTEFFFGITLTNTNAVPLSVHLPTYFGKMMVMWGEVGSLSVIAVAPLFVLSLLVQRYLVRGLTLGAVK
jgi:multiple sugar transport system permease protein